MGQNGKKNIYCGQSVFEILEVRKLLSTVNVTDFGAAPNDGRDDRGAILAAVNSSHAGDTILFSKGTFNVSDVLNLPGDRTYKGNDGATLKGRGGSGSLIDFHVDNVTVTNLSFDGGGIFIDKPGSGMNNNVTIDHTTFRLNTSGEKPSAITFTSGLQNSKITNNYFTGYNGAFAAYGYNYKNLTIANNEMVDITAGMHIDAHGNSGDLVVKNNYIKGVRGMGLEFQGSANNLKFLDNFYEHPNLSSDPNRNMNSMAYSLILDKSSNIQIKRNTVIAPEAPDGIGMRVGIEMGGDNSIVEDNYINGGSVSAYSTDGVGSGSVTFRNNKVMNVDHGDYQAFPAPGRTYQSYNNGPNVQLSWDVNRAKPGIDDQPPKVEDVAPIKSPDKKTDSSDDKKSTGNDKQTRAKLKYDEDAFTYVSDMDMVAGDNGWGPIELNQTNGSRDANDGSAITLNGKEYDKGIGVAINSTVTYDLAGKYARFFSDIGVDDATGGEGSVTFQVWADGKKIFDSGVIHGNDAKKGVNVDVTGVKELKLVTTDANDGDRNDHADWAAPRLLTGSQLNKALSQLGDSKPDASTSA